MKKKNPAAPAQQWKLYALLHILLLVFSLAPVCNKMAGRQEFMGFPFLAFYGCSLFILAVYALFWQQIIKRMPLTVAYANKAITVVWGMVWGTVIFNEQISVQKMIGAAVIIGGIVLFALSPTSEDGAKENFATDGNDTALEGKDAN